MNLPLIQNHADAICIDHVFPTMSGALIHTESISVRNRDPRVRDLTARPGRDGHIYLAFGQEIDAAMGHGRGEPGAARGQAVMDQFLRSLPAEVADRTVVRLLEPGGLSLDKAAARANLAGLPVEVRVSDLAEAGPGEKPVDPGRLIGFDEAMGLTPVADAETLWIVPERHWAPDAYAGADPEAVRAALLSPYPTAAIVFDGSGTVRLGMPAPLVSAAYGAVLSGLGRQLDTHDLPGTGGRAIPGYGDLITAMSAPGSRGFVEVHTPDGASVVVLAHHDHHGLSFLDPGTAGAAVLPASTSSIVLHPVEGAPELAGWLAEIAANRPLPPMRQIRHTSGVHSLPIGDGNRSVDVIGDQAAVTGRFRTELIAAAEGADGPVIVIATPRPSDRPSARQLFDLEHLLFQHRQNQLAGGPPPTVIIRGDAPAAVLDLVGTYPFAVVQQPSNTGRTGTGFGLNLDNLWIGRDATGKQVSAPVRSLTADFLRTVGAARPEVTAVVAPELAELLSTPLDDVVGLKSVLAEHGSTLKTLAPQIDGLSVQPDLFAGWQAILRIEGRADETLSRAAFDYLGAGDARGRTALSQVPLLVDRDPASRAEGFSDLIDLTRGPLDDGASRAILGAIKLGMEGAPLESIKHQIYQHSAYLPESGRTDIIREVRAMMQQRPEHSELFEHVAVYVETCP
ncbi:hypothetical protein [Catenuloplanes indicus]|uniref:Uncharacterized protein n=1 Tax=Catenuloplanes indicus TaxID=137267 RepID=A0AAE4B1T6_9ACTN|nr:hypothetical protein [Catenuloplanes indicus]MDQ0369946.1 hypothetical protein [Catenuloplanes indicus]